MQDDKGRKSEGPGEVAEELRDRAAEATSDKTLGELEDEQKIGNVYTGKEDEVPSPDAEPVGHREKRDDAGPM